MTWRQPNDFSKEAVGRDERGNRVEDFDAGFNTRLATAFGHDYPFRMR